MYKISVCILFCFSIPAILGVSPEMQELFDMLHNTCQGQSGAEEAIIKKAQGGDFQDDPKFKCYIKCIMTEMSTISDDGVIDVEATVALLPPDLKPKVEPAIRKCGSQAGADACDSAFLTFKCYFANTNDFFLP